MAQLDIVRWKIDTGDDDTTSNEIDLRSRRLVAIQMPTAWTAAAIAFYARPGLPKGDPGNDVAQLAFVVEASAEQYRVLTQGEQAMAAGLAWTTIVSVDPDSLPDTVAQADDRLLIGVTEPRC